MTDFTLGVAAGCLLAAWLAFLLWTWRLRHPAPVLANSGYILSLETQAESFKSMLTLQMETGKALSRRVTELKAEVSYLRAQLQWLLSVQPQPTVGSIYCFL